MCRTVPGLRSPLEGLGSNPYPAEVPEGRTHARAPEGLNPYPVMVAAQGAVPEGRVSNRSRRDVTTGGTWGKPVPSVCAGGTYPFPGPGGIEPVPGQVRGAGAGGTWGKPVPGSHSMLEGLGSNPYPALEPPNLQAGLGDARCNDVGAGGTWGKPVPGFLHLNGMREASQ